MATLERLQVTLTAAEQALASFDKAHQIGPTDPGTHSMNRHKTEARMGRDVQRFVNKMGREKAARDRLEKAAETAWNAVYNEGQRIHDESVAHTLDNLTTARIVRDSRYGWGRVIRVNKTTVTVRDMYGERRVPMDRIKEARE